MPNDLFQFKQFTIHQDRTALKVGTDGVVLGAWADVENARRILDIGTGTGLLALMAAQRNSSARIDAVEIDDASAGQAAENVARSPWADRVCVHRMDVRRMSVAEPYDVILCNPPFYAGEMAPSDARVGVAKHGGELDFEELIAAVDRLVGACAHFSCIIPMNRERELDGFANTAGLHTRRRTPLQYLAVRPAKRVLLELARNVDRVEEEDPLVVEAVPGEYTDVYRSLLKDFMLKF